MGCDNVWEPGVANWSISIHAPTWGATCKPQRRSGGRAYFNPRTHMGCDEAGLYKYTQAPDFISIHAPTWGATATSTRGSTNTRYFNPRTHMGCDRTFHRHMRPLYRRALAPPTWGATTADQYEKNCSFSGTRATHMGCDWLTVYLPL